METQKVIILTLAEAEAQVILPLEANLKYAGVSTFEELKEKWLKSYMYYENVREKPLFEKEPTVQPINSEELRDKLHYVNLDAKMICPGFNIVCFRDKMYKGWGTYFSCWYAYEFGGHGQAEWYTD